MEYVSIHAPAWGATMQSITPAVTYAVSIHAPAWGATKYYLWICRFVLFQSTLPHGERHGPKIHVFADAMFQSTLPHGERRFLVGRMDRRSLVSIHAPAWGATITGLFISPGHISFNPRSRMGSDGFFLTN